MDVKVSASEQLAINVMVAGIGALILWDSASLEGGSAYFPLAVGLGLIGMSVVSAGYLLWRRSGDTRTGEATLFHGLAGLALLGGFVASAGQLGFLTSTLWFLPAMSILGGERNWWRVLLITLLFTLLAWVLFRGIFAQTLPPEWIFGDV